MKKPLLTTLLLLLAESVFAQNLKKDLDSLLTKHISEGQLHGCVAYVQQVDKILHFQSYGLQNIEQNKKMANDAIFRIASMSKLIVVAGALKLYEEDEFLLDDPVKKYLPQFANLKVMQNIGTDSSKIVNLKRDITIRDLFRITAGFGDLNTNDTIKTLSVVYKLDSAKTPDEYLNILCKIPLRYQPGSRWVYGGVEIKVLGLLIEKITAKNLQDYLTESIFTPLEMASTGFYIEPKNIGRFSSYYLYEKGEQKNGDNAPTSSSYIQLPAILNGSAGLVSSASNLANFYNMILHYGKFKGKQILKSQTVELLISNQIATFKDRGWEVAGFGLGVGVNQGRSPIFNGFIAAEPDNNNGKTKSIFWSGSPYNTRFFIDFDKQIIAIFLTQNAPFGHLGLMSKFELIVNKNVK